MLAIAILPSQAGLCKMFYFWLFSKLIPSCYKPYEYAHWCDDISQLPCFIGSTVTAPTPM